MNPICYYHKSDLDGICSAAIVKHFVPECELYGMDYGMDLPWDLVRPGPDAENDPVWADCFKPENGYKGPEQNGGFAMEEIPWVRRTVYMVDFSLPIGDMKRLAALSDLVWIDHHKTAIDAWAASPGPRMLGLHCTTQAACELAWRFFTKEAPNVSLTSPIPEAVRLLGAYDTWRKGDPEWESKIMPFQYGVRCAPDAYNPNSVTWTRLLRDGVAPVMFGPITWCDDQDTPEETVSRAGYAVLAFQRQQNQRTAEAGAFEAVLRATPGSQWRRVGDEKEVGFYFARFEFTPGDYAEPLEIALEKAYRCICLNTPLFSSQSFDSVYDTEKHDLMVPFAKMANGKWKVSLYSTKPEIDCGAIAKTFGGGGHKGAAGFVCNQLPWES